MNTKKTGAIIDITKKTFHC